MNKLTIKYITYLLIYIFLFFIGGFSNITYATSSYINPHKNKLSTSTKEKLVLIVDRIKNKENNFSGNGYKEYLEGFIYKLDKLRDIYQKKSGLSNNSRERIMNIISYIVSDFENLISIHNKSVIDKQSSTSGKNKCEEGYTGYACDIINGVFSSDGSHYVDNSSSTNTNNSTSSNSSTSTYSSTCAYGYSGVGCNIYKGAFVNESHYATTSNTTSSNTSTNDTESNCEEGYGGFLVI